MLELRLPCGCGDLGFGGGGGGVAKRSTEDSGGVRLIWVVLQNFGGG